MYECCANNWPTKFNYKATNTLLMNRTKNVSAIFLNYHNLLFIVELRNGNCFYFSCDFRIMCNMLIINKGSKHIRETNSCYVAKVIISESQIMSVRPNGVGVFVQWALTLISPVFKALPDRPCTVAGCPCWCLYVCMLLSTCHLIFLPPPPSARFQPSNQPTNQYKPVARATAV